MSDARQKRRTSSLRLSQPPSDITAGDSPLPGLFLHRILRGHTEWINRIEWSPTETVLASVGNDQTIQIWDANSAKLKQTLQKHTDAIVCLTWSPDGKYLVTGSGDKLIHIWDMKKGNVCKTLIGHTNWVFSVDWSPCNRFIASGSTDNRIIIWDPQTGKQLESLSFPAGIFYIAWSPISMSEQRLATASEDGNVYIWNSGLKKTEAILSAHRGQVLSLAWSPDGRYLVSGSVDNTIRVWGTESWNQKYVIEGHTGHIRSLSFSYNGEMLASKSSDNTVRLWNCSSWDTVAEIAETCSGAWAAGIAFHPSTNMLATLGDEDIIRIWTIDTSMLLHNALIVKSVKYTTAKIVLVGDSGVGKSGLGWRLSHGQFRDMPSTHGQMFWIVDELCRYTDDYTQCVTVLWDLAGQHVYRSIHSIFFDNITVAVIVFDPTNRQDPLKGVRYWVGQLQGNDNLPPSILIGARVDEGMPTLTEDDLKQFCQQHGIVGGYISTSAKAGTGIDEVLKRLSKLIQNAELTTTITTLTFKRIREYILNIKGVPNIDRDCVIMPVEELKRLLFTEDPDWKFNKAEMGIAIKHLENHGYISILRNSDSEYILLKPELLPCMAASIVLMAEQEPSGLGAIDEKKLLMGRYSFEALANLDQEDKLILIEAAVLRFLEHNVCLRVTNDNNDTLLIFPGLIKQKRPLVDAIPMMESTSYLVRGKIENLYPVLFVLIGNTPTFNRINQWQNQVQYEMNKGEICGFRMLEDREGEVELVLYFNEKVDELGRKKFQQIFEHFLYQRKVTVKSFQPLFCSNRHQIPRSIVAKFMHEDRKTTFCSICGQKVGVPRSGDSDGLGIMASKWLQREEAVAKLRTTYEAYLSKIKSYRRGWENPRCYISCASRKDNKVDRFIRDLLDAGIYIVEDINNMQAEDWIIVMVNDSYKALWETPTSDFQADVNLIKERLSRQRQYVISIVIDDNSRKISKHHSKDCSPGNFYDVTHYPVSMFDLILVLYNISLRMNEYAELRIILHEQWENIPELETPLESKKRFDIALSFPGEHRPFVKLVADHLCRELGSDRVFYDGNYEAELLGFNMDTYLQDIYHKHSENVVVFLCEEYDAKFWCGIEWRAIRSRNAENYLENVVPVCLDDRNRISGIYSIDNPIDATNYQFGSPNAEYAREIAKKILSRYYSARGRSL